MTAVGLAALPLVLAVGCGPATPVHEDTPAAAPEPVTLSIVGTNDLHGHVDRVAVLGGFVANLRRVREREGGGVLLVDGGDMFQGTVESNLREGAPVVAAYDAIGYHAAAIGNHEFDFGPVGPAVTANSPDDDPRGALVARAEQARFAMLTANILDAETGERVDWPDMLPTTMVRVAGVDVGIVGVSTMETLVTTIPANVIDLAMAPLAETIARYARQLRADGAEVVVVAAHAGGRCTRFEQPRDLSSCEHDHEIFEVARALSPGLVDVIVAGHTHAGIAHEVNGIAIIESYAYGRAFGRVDLRVSPATGGVVVTRIHPPQELCHDIEAPLSDCRPGDYEGLPVEIDERVVAAIADDLEAARAIRNRPLGVTVAERFDAAGGRESALGNLLADLILEARPAADVALMNGGGIRAPFREGELTYGDLYETFPFDNRFATVHTTPAELEAFYARSLAEDGTFFSIAGARVRARCEDGAITVELLRPDGTPWPDDVEVTVATSDFLAMGGDGFHLGEGVRVEVEDGEPMREALADRLRARGGSLRPADFLDPDGPRVAYPGDRPVRCE